MEANRSSLLPNLVTVGNGICGFASLAILARLDLTPAEGGAGLALEPLVLLTTASWLVLLGMVFDVFDGKVARMTGAASPLGAQLDSLCDLVTFGLVPSIMILRLGGLHDALWWQRITWFFSLAYFLGAVLRLARFTAESEPDETAHEAFKGLPTPGAAGCVASLVLFYTYIMTFRAKELQWLSDFVRPETIQAWVAAIPYALPPLGLILGYAMVSNRLIYEHVGSQLFSRRHSFDSLAYLIFGGLLIGVMPEPLLPVLFLGYLALPPLKLFGRLFRARPEESQGVEGPRV